MSKPPSLPPPPNPAPPAAPEPAPATWERTAYKAFALVVIVGALLYIFRSCLSMPGKAVDKTIDRTVQVFTNVGRTLSEMAAAFNQGSVTVNLLSEGIQLENTQLFQFKKIKQTEIFTHTDQASTAFGYVPLPDVIVEARVPVEYTYYLDLKANWQLHIQGQTVHVLTPDIRFNKPALDVSRLQYEVRRDSVFRSSTAALDHLKSSLTSLSVLKARENLRLARDTGREPVAEFVSQWLLRSFTDATNYQVRVHFPGDPSAVDLPWQAPVSER